jgi:Caspase domain/RNA binding activity-knot of a chromodomain
MRPFMRVAILMASAVSSTADAATIWNPATTYVLVASVTQWPSEAGLAPFTGERRRDDDLVTQFKRSGVPAANIIFLKDSAATHAAMCNSLSSLAARAGPGSTLIFYFQGHGGRKVFCCYDVAQNAFHAEEIFPILDKAWKGDRLLLLGDCCSSGSLASVVRQYERLRPNVRAACIASATASNMSTGHWTFAAALIRVFAGDPQVDRNHDGQITLGEADQFIHDQMKFQENQLAGIFVTPSFENDFVIRRAVPGMKIAPRIPGPHQIGDVLEARDSEGNWYISEILDWKGSNRTYKVHFYGWDSKWDEWLNASRLRPIVKPKLNVGQQYEVQWEDNNWYLGTITKTVEDWFYFVHYESEAGDDDEWVTPERARPPRQASARNKPQFAAVVAPRDLAIGQVVAAQWNQEWYRAKIAYNVNGTYAVLYDDQTKGRLAMDDLIPVARPNEIRAGDRVLACWDGKPKMYPGKVESIKDQLVTVRWEDGTPPTQVPLNAVARIKP